MMPPTPGALAGRCAELSPLRAQTCAVRVAEVVGGGEAGVVGGGENALEIEKMRPKLIAQGWALAGRRLHSTRSALIPRDAVVADPLGRPAACALEDRD